MIVSVAFCPHTPLLVPAVDASQVPELVDLRDAAQAAVRAVLATAPDRVVILGAGDIDDDETAGADFGPYGVPFAVGGPRQVLGLPHAVGAWLLDDAGWTGPRTYAPRPSAVDESGAADERVAWLVMADGTTQRTDRAPGSFDPRAEAFDATVVSALGSAEAQALAELDVDQGAELGATGLTTLTAAGRVLAAQRSPAAAQVRYDGAPLGVGSWVADWVY